MIQITTQPGNICTNLLFKNFSSTPLNFLSHFDSASWYSTTAADLFEYNPMHILLRFQKWGSRQTEVGQTQNAMNCEKIIRQCFSWLMGCKCRKWTIQYNPKWVLATLCGERRGKTCRTTRHQLLYDLGLCMKLDLLLKLQAAASCIVLRIQPSHLLVPLLLLLKDQQIWISLI